MSLRVVAALFALLVACTTEAKLQGHGSGSRELFGSTCEDYAEFYNRCCVDKDGDDTAVAGKCDWGFLTGLPDPGQDYPNCCCPVRNNIAQSAWDKKCSKITEECPNLTSGGG